MLHRVAVQSGPPSFSMVSAGWIVLWIFVGCALVGLTYCICYCLEGTYEPTVATQISPVNIQYENETSRISRMNNQDEHVRCDNPSPFHVQPSYNSTWDDRGQDQTNNSPSDDRAQDQTNNSDTYS